MERLDKILASQGLGTRKEVQRLIRQGEVRADGEVVFNPQLKLDPDRAEITVGGQRLEFKKHLYIMMNKPGGVVCAAYDRDCATVIDILPDNLKRRGLFPVGRLDKDTEGLLIITDDGDFAHRLTSPKSHIYKRYYVQVDKKLNGDLVNLFKKGIILADGKKCMPASLEIAGEACAYVEICQGMYHQVKKMFAVYGYNVKYLKRVSIGGLKLDSNLPEGSSRELTKNEQSAFFVVK